MSCVCRRSSVRNSRKKNSLLFKNNGQACIFRAHFVKLSVGYKACKSRRVPTPRPVAGAWPGQAGATGRGISRTFPFILPTPASPGHLQLGSSHQNFSIYFDSPGQPRPVAGARAPSSKSRQSRKLFVDDDDPYANEITKSFTTRKQQIY